MNKTQKKDELLPDELLQLIEEVYDYFKHYSDPDNFSPLDVAAFARHKLQEIRKKE